MRNEYRAGPIYRTGLIVSGSMCAGLGIAVLVALALHQEDYARVLPASVPTPPVEALGFAACGLALIGIGFWFPRVTSVLAAVTLSLAVTLVMERALEGRARVEAMVAARVGAGNWYSIAPNTVVVLVLAAAALLLRHKYQWFEGRLATIAVLGSIIVAIGVVGCVGYMAGVPTYAWQSLAPMSFPCAVCSCALGLGIIMSACRYTELDDSGAPRWFSAVVCTGALAINLTTAVAYLCRGGRAWPWAEVKAFLPMILVSGALSVLAAFEARKRSASAKRVEL
jgi:hypothetical protein